MEDDIFAKLSDGHYFDTDITESISVLHLSHRLVFNLVFFIIGVHQRAYENHYTEYSGHGRLERGERGTEEIPVHVGFKCFDVVPMRKYKAWKIIPHTCRSAYKRIPVFDNTSEVGLEGELMSIRSVTFTFLIKFPKSKICLIPTKRKKEQQYAHTMYLHI